MKTFMSTVYNEPETVKWKVRFAWRGNVDISFHSSIQHEYFNEIVEIRQDKANNWLSAKKIYADFHWS